MSVASWSGFRNYVAPLLRRPAAVQMAALCHRDGDNGPEILLVQSTSGRWILPKGWPMEGKDGAETALTEAWEEAGVKQGKPKGDALGPFQSTKSIDDGPDLRCETYVYPIVVRKMTKDYPEAGQRKRRWVPLDDAASIVDEDGLRDILNDFATKLAA